MYVRPPGLTGNQTIVWDIIDAMALPPVKIDDYYTSIVIRAAAHVGNPSTVGVNFNSEISLKNAALSARNNVYDMVNRVSAFSARAKNAGFSPPDNPLALIGGLTSKNQGIEITPDLADKIVYNVGVYLDLLKAESEGKIDFSKAVYSASQLSSIGLGLEGYGNSGGVATSLMGFLPDAEAISKQKADEALAALDFRKRVPKMLFTADYAPDGQTKGAIVGWHKIADASGYILKRHAMFQNSDSQRTISNVDLRSQRDLLADYVRAWVLSFYDQIDINSICFYLDEDLRKDEYYNYNIQAYQVQNIETNAIFNIESVPANLSLAQRSIIQQGLMVGDIVQDSFSPYPLIAKQIYGDERFDWVLAAVNVRAAVNRAENRTTVRGYSYVGASITNTFQMMDQGKFFIPKDVNEIPKRIADAIAQFGVTQVISEILEETGILFYLEDRDPKGPSTPFTQAGAVSADAGSSQILSAVISAVDPETATLDLKAFSANASQIIKGFKPSVDTTFPRVQSRPSEIAMMVPDVSQTEVQTFVQPGQIDKDTVDLTTFDGLGQFVKLIRVFTDYGVQV